MNDPYQDDQRWWRLVFVVLWMAGVLAIGTLGYRVVEGWSAADSFYMTVITISTVGYGEPNTLSQPGRWFTSFLIFISLISMTGATAVLTSVIIGGDLSGQLQRRRALKRISRMKDHTIVCGTGRMATAVIERLLSKRVQIVIVDDDNQSLTAFKEKYRRVETVCGVATNELVLAKANVLDAKHVVAATDSDTSNLLIGITCKDLGAEISVIAESHDASIGNRMRKCGIDEVISPSQLGGQRVCEVILK